MCVCVCVCVCVYVCVCVCVCVGGGGGGRMVQDQETVPFKLMTTANPSHPNGSTRPKSLFTHSLLHTFSTIILYSLSHPVHFYLQSLVRHLSYTSLACPGSRENSSNTACLIIFIGMSRKQKYFC